MEEKQLLTVDTINSFDKELLLKIALFDKEYSQDKRDEFVKFYISFVEEKNLIGFEKVIEACISKLSIYQEFIRELRREQMKSRFKKEHKR